MYLDSKVSNPIKLYDDASNVNPVGPNFSDEQIEKADSMEIWFSSFKDEGDDFTEFRLLKDGEIILTKRINGY